MKRLLKEPLLHFLLLGAAIFVAYSLVSKHSSVEPGKIVITQAQVSAMTLGFNRAWQRPPTTEELQGLIRNWVQEEVYCREAMALGLDKDDTVIRRRLRQKMEFVTADVASLAEPTEKELSTYLKGHADAFRAPQQFTFSQIYLNPERHGKNLARDTAQLLAQLSQAGGKADDLALGDPFLLEHKFEAVSSSEAARQFGEKFARRLGELALGQWQGPVESSYGVHLVFVTQRTEVRVPALEEVRDAVHREWVNAQRLEANEKFYQSLLRNYIVSIERPQSAELRQ